MFETNALLKKYSKSVMTLSAILIILILVGEFVSVHYMNYSGILEIGFMEKMKRKLIVPGILYISTFIIGLVLLKNKKLTITQKSIVPIAVVTVICLVFLVNNNKNSLSILSLVLPIILAVLNAETEVEVTKRNAFACIGITSLVAAILFFKNYGLGYEYIMNLFVALEFLIALILICSILCELERTRNDMLVASIKEKEYYHEKATIDGLTKSYNRASYNETINENFDKYDILSLAVIDIDKFKSINDTYGHANGDVVLRILGKILNNINSEDTYVARYGGEEFVILFFGKTKEQAFKTVEKLKDKFTNHTFKELNNHHVSFSCGIAQKNKKSTQKSLFEAADKALYEAKEKGRNRIIISK